MASPSSPVASDGSDAFFSYPSISSAKQISSLRRKNRDICEGEWIATEKIHGCNFSVTFLPGSETPLYASRNMFLTKAFHNHKAVMAPYLPSIIRLMQHFRAEVAKADVRVQLFGEMYGTAVQKINVVFYTSKVADFVAFDLFVDNLPVHRDVMFAAFEQFDLPHVKVRARGKLDTLLELNPVFESDFRLQLGALGELPEQFKAGNPAEGMVLQSVASVMREYDGEWQHLMLKHKNPTHTEITVSLKSMVVTDVNKPRTLPSMSKLSQELQTLIQQALCNVNLARLGNTLSKLGEEIAIQALSTKPPANVASKRFEVAKALAADALQDFVAEPELSGTQKEQAIGHKQVIHKFLMAQSFFIIDDFIAQNSPATTGTSPQI